MVQSTETDERELFIDFILRIILRVVLYERVFF